MDTKGRKLFRYIAGIMTAVVLMGSAYATTAMASGIGLIDTADLLDIHAEASASSAVVGQVMDEGHVAILGRADGWVQIKAGDIIGWVPEENLIETEISNEEAYEANQKVVAEFAEDVMEALEEDQETASEDVQPEEEPDSETEEQDEAWKEQQKAAEPNSDEEEAAQELAAEQERLWAEAQEQAAEQARLLAEAQKQAAEQAEAFAREQARAAQELQKQAEEQAAEQSQEQVSAETVNAGSVSAEELELLANIIYCEAKGEPYIGKVAVANVVLNRVKSSKYPDTIKDVIYAKGQFSPVSNGSMAKAIQNDSADESCYQAALEALAGAAPVGDKTSFRRVNGRSGQVIGHHVFY